MISDLAVKAERTHEPAYGKAGSLVYSDLVAGIFPVKKKRILLVRGLGILKRGTILGVLKSNKDEKLYAPIRKKSDKPFVSKIDAHLENVPAEPPPESVNPAPGDQETAKPATKEIKEEIGPCCILAETTNTDKENPFSVCYLTGEFSRSEVIYPDSFEEAELEDTLETLRIFLV